MNQAFNTIAQNIEFMVGLTLIGLLLVVVMFMTYTLTSSMRKVQADK